MQLSSTWNQKADTQVHTPFSWAELTVSRQQLPQTSHFGAPQQAKRTCTGEATTSQHTDAKIP